MFGGALRRAEANTIPRDAAAPTLPSMSDSYVTLRPDVRQLRDLLSVLPNLDDLEKREWWDRYAAAHHQHQGAGAALGRERPGGHMVGRLKYLLDKYEGDYEHDLAADCLRFFDDPSPEMVSLVGQALGLPGSGARVLESVCAVAWRIYVATAVAEDRVAQY